MKGTASQAIGMPFLYFCDGQSQMYCLLRGEKDQTHGPKPLLLRRVGIKLNLASNKFLGLLLSLQRHPSNSGRMVPHYRSYEKVAVRSHPLPRRGNGNGTTYGPPAIRHESIALEESFLKQWAQVLHQFGAVLALNKNQPCVVRYTPTKSHWLRQSGAVRWDLQK